MTPLKNLALTFAAFGFCLLVFSQPEPTARADEPPGAALVAQTLDAGFKSPSMEDLAIGMTASIVAIVLLVELFRYMFPALRRKRGTPLSDHARIGVVMLALGFGEACAFFGVAPPVTPGWMGQVTAGIVATGIAVLFNETVFAFIRAQVRKRLGGTSTTSDDDEDAPPEDAVVYLAFATSAGGPFVAWVDLPESARKAWSAAAVAARGGA